MESFANVETAVLGPCASDGGAESSPLYRWRPLPLGRGAVTPTKMDYRIVLLATFEFALSEPDDENARTAK